MNRFHPSMLILVVGLCVSFGSAASVTIENYSFENATGSGAQATAPSDWESTYTLDNQSQYPTDEMTIYARVDSGSLTNKDGNNYLRLYVDTYPGTSTYGAIVGSATEILCSTSLGTYQANTVYTLTVAVAVDQSQTNRQAGISLLADDEAAAAASWTFAEWVTDAGSSTFADAQVVLDTSADTGVVGKEITIQFTHAATAGAMYGRNAYFDNVRLDATLIPEPTSLALLLGGGWVWLRRRR